MSDTVISVENLSKRYFVGHRASLRSRPFTLREMLVRETHNFTRKAIDLVRGRNIVQGDEIEEFWALKNVSFEVKRGEVVGIIGRNGSGKSTLLKILSRITDPTEGRAVIRGRVASLLEVGTGFHSELTGRENIFLNGAILGMTQREIRAKFDEIVAFAEVERFLDTPVKRYSSGMYVRLAFAVAAHLEPDILLVDEVLAVGDTEFQKKCLDKMDDVARREGRTVLFVSHNMAAVAELSKKGVVLDAGSVIQNGPIEDAISVYLSRGGNQTTYIAPPEKNTDAPHVSRIDLDTTLANGIQDYGKPLTIRFTLSHRRPIPKAHFSFHIINQFQQRVIFAYAYHSDVTFAQKPGETVLVCHFPHVRLNVGQYHLRTYFSGPPGGEFFEGLDDICPFTVVRTDKSVLWGWQAEACAYHEDWEWSKAG